MSGPLAGYPSSAADEAVGPAGLLHGGYAVLGPALARLGTAGLADLGAALAAEHRSRGVTVGSWRDGRPRVHPLPLDPLPRLIHGDDWRRIAAGVEQRHRALNAFLADVYRPAGRRRGDTDRAPEIVRSGAVPEWAITHSPGRDPQAVGLAWPGQPRAAVAGVDLLRTAGGEWLVARDDLRVPVGLGYALAARESACAVAPELFGPEVFATPGQRPADPHEAIGLLQAGLAAAAPPACARTPRLAVLTTRETDTAEFEQRLLATALDAPLVHPAQLWPRPDGGVEAAVGGERVPVDVLHRRLDDASLGAYRTSAGPTLDVLLGQAVRAGRLGLANVPGNAVADDAAAYAWVPAMIRFYLGEEPLLGSVRSWVLADPDQWAQVRDRLHELVVEPIAGYGGSGTVVGPECSAAELAALQAEVAAAPHRFVAREPVDSTTAPALVDGHLQPRHVELRVLSVAGPQPRALPAPLSLVALEAGSRAVRAGQGAGAKDTWLLQ